MDQDELKNKYGQRYCFAPYQGDMFYDAQIRMHLMNMQKHCKLVHQYDILNREHYSYSDEFRASLSFFECLPAMEHRLLARLDRALHIPYSEQRIVEVRLVVWGFFKSFREEKLFDWP